METKFWTLDAINRNGIFFRIGYNGTLADAKKYAGGLSAMYYKLKGCKCGVIIYDANCARLLTRAAASVDCSNRHEELWINALVRESIAGNNELSPIPDMIMAM